jgi:hypothetical protein
MKFDALRKVIVKNILFLDMTPLILVKVGYRIGETRGSHLQGYLTLIH